jgi:itaconyl-CoA hydratase
MVATGRTSSLTSDAGNWYEDFTVGQRMRHARGLTIGEVENGFLSKMVMNTAQAHWNEHFLEDGPLGSGRVVFGLITAAVVFGLASQDIAENAIAELGCTKLRFLAPVHHGDTVYALTEIVDKEDGTDPDAGIITCHHWGLTQDDRVVFEGDRTVLVRRRHP